MLGQFRICTQRRMRLADDTGDAINGLHATLRIIPRSTDSSSLALAAAGLSFRLAEDAVEPRQIAVSPVFVLPRLFDTVRFLDQSCEGIPGEAVPAQQFATFDSLRQCCGWVRVTCWLGLLCIYIYICVLCCAGRISQARIEIVAVTPANILFLRFAPRPPNLAYLSNKKA